MNRVAVVGNLTRDAQIRRTQSGMAVLSIGIAVNDRRKNPQTGEWGDYANFFDCTMFGSRAESLAQYLVKGQKVAIDGKLRWSQWQKDGQNRSKVEIVVDDIDLLGGKQGTTAVYEASTSTSGPAIEVEATVFDSDCPF